MKFKLLVILFFLIKTLYSQQTIEENLQHDGLTRLYDVFLPSSYSANGNFPVVIMLHGGGGDKDVIKGFTQLNPVANTLDYIAVYPQGFEPVAIGGFSWADGRGTSADNAGIDDVGFISTLINQLKSDYAIDDQRVYVAGFSNGGFMTQTLACEIPGELSAVAALGSSLGVSQSADCNTAEATPMLYVVGTADPEIPYNGGTMTNPNVEPIIGVEAAVQFWVNKNNCNPSPQTTNLPDTVTDDNSTVELLTYDNCDCSSDVYFYKIVNGGHTWPGNEIPSLEPQLGETNEDINAGFRMLNFFNNHVLCQSLSTHEVEFKNDVVINPNPTQNNFKINTSVPVTKIQLFSLTGKKLAEHSGLQQTSFSLDVSHLPAGIYWIKLLRNDSFVTQKLILE